jgi:hypothetical protein
MLLQAWKDAKWEAEKKKPPGERMTKTDIIHMVYEAAIALKNRGRKKYNPDSSEFKNAWYLMHHYRMRLPPADGIGPKVEIEWAPHKNGKQETAEAQTERQVGQFKSLCNRAVENYSCRLLVCTFMLVLHVEMTPSILVLRRN